MHAKIRELTNKKENVKTDSGYVRDKEGTLLLRKRA